MSSLDTKLVMLIGLLMANPLAAASLYNPDTYRSLVSDHRAYRVGDALTVVIYESASAKSTTNADTNKTVQVGINASDGYSAINGNANLNNQFAGGGTLSRSDAVVATVSVTVTEILPGGDLAVHGEQQITFNQEAQLISVDGRVRPADISSNNVVQSNRLADARINYTGDGLLSNGQKPGLITRFFNWLF